MRECGTKSGTMKAMKDTGASSYEMLPENDEAIADVIDGKHCVRRLCFAKDDIAFTYKQIILSKGPAYAVAVVTLPRKKSC